MEIVKYWIKTKGLMPNFKDLLIWIYFIIYYYNLNLFYNALLVINFYLDFFHIIFVAFYPNSQAIAELCRLEISLVQDRLIAMNLLDVTAILFFFFSTIFSFSLFYLFAFLYLVVLNVIIILPVFLRCSRMCRWCNAGPEWKITESSSNSSQVNFIYFYANTLGKCMDLSCLFPAMG